MKIAENAKEKYQKFQNLCIFLQEIADELNIEVKPSIYNDYIKLVTR